MKILPPVTRPWRVKIERRHVPRLLRAAESFQSFRSCLRWEFGFCCAFCLCHEADLAPYGSEGAALMHIEHFVPQSRDRARRNDYANCFLICRFCNVSRGAAVNESLDGRSLRNPCDGPWLEAFVVKRDEMRPRDEDDGDAGYTWEAYELNDPRKVRMRRMRRQTIVQCMRFLKRTHAYERDLLDRAETEGDEEAARIAWAISDARRRARRDLEKFAVVPHDADASCLCKSGKALSLPNALEEQAIDLGSLRPPRRNPRAN